MNARKMHSDGVGVSLLGRSIAEQFPNGRPARQGRRSQRAGQSDLQARRRHERVFAQR
jgi:hypothetical protein